MAPSSSKQLHVLLYGKLYLPALSLALLTGFTFSITLPPALHSLFPALQSLFLVSLPHLWHASLSWFTPPCLFLLLNGIIMILTATSSSSFANKPPPPVPPTAPSSAATTPPIQPLSVDAVPPEIHPSTLPALQLEGPIASSSNIPLCYHCLHAPDADMGEHPEHVICHGAFNELNNSDDDNMKEMQIISHEVEIADTLKIDGSDDPATSSYEEVLKGGSEPSTPKCSSNPTAVKDNMRRSLSIDSMPYIDNVEESPEYKLSEEAFKKRIEDYIFKVNAKLRSETRFN